MDKTRTLPPLVRGKATGVLNFFVDEIRIFKNSLLLTDKFDLVLQVQWWGESLPAFVRPEKLQVEGRSCKNSHSLEFYYHFIKYEIKTTLDLFKLYLKSCERVEFCVLETAQKYIIGSAFLRELPNLLNNNDKPIKMSVYNYLGIVIGEVTMHVNFLENLHHKHKSSQNEVTLSDRNSYLDKKLERIEGEEISEKLKSNFFTLSEKTLFYDVQSKINSQKKDIVIHLESPTDECHIKNNRNFKNSDANESISNESNNLLIRQEINMNQKFELDSNEFSYKCLPKIKTSSDSSKVLYFGVSSQQPNSKINVKNNGAKIVNKFNSNSIKCKSKSENMKSSFSSDQNLCNKKFNIEKSESSKNLSKNISKLKKKKVFDFEDSLFCNNLKPNSVLDSKQADLQSTTSKDSPNYKVLDYLLGSDMSKDDEEIALNNFKEMSPSRDLVDSISQLCLDSDNNVEMTENGSYIKSPLISLKPNYLKFDFNNPIERNYYKKFFLKSNNNADFEVAEFLNLPENRIKYDKLKFNETHCQINEAQNTSSKSTVKSLYADEQINDTKIKENHSVNKVCVSNKSSSCGRCKYYKKLDDLDAIIESLKHFEQKMLKHNKDLQLDFKQN